MRRDIANHPTTILIIISLLMLASCGQRQTLKEPMQVTRSQPAVRHLYEALTFGQEFDDILIERIDDTLLYAQLWPSEKFKIENRHNDFFVPLVVTTDGDSCLSMVRNKLLDPDIIHRINSGDCRIVLLSHLPIIEQLECVNPPGVGVVINFCRVENDSGCNVELFEDYSDGTIDLALGSKLTYPGGGTVDCGVTIDETIPAVRLTTAIKPAYDGSVGPQLNAGGTVTFTPPADEFELSIDGDRYRVVLGRDSVTVKPLTVCDHILSPAAQARLPRDVFGVVFDQNVKFENFQYIDEERIHRYEIITPDRRDGLIRRFEQMGAHLVVLDEQQLHSCRIKRERSVNSINWRLRNAGGNLPTMFFTYEGDFENVRRVFDQIAGQPGVKALFSSRR